MRHGEFDTLLFSRWPLWVSGSWIFCLSVMTLLTMVSFFYTALPGVLQGVGLCVTTGIGSYLVLRDGLLMLPESIIEVSYYPWHQQWYLCRRSGEIIPITLRASSRLFAYSTVFRAQDEVGKSYSLMICHDGLQRDRLSRLRVLMLSGMTP